MRARVVCWTPTNPSRSLVSVPMKSNRRRLPRRYRSLPVSVPTASSPEVPALDTGSPSRRGPNIWAWTSAEEPSGHARNTATIQTTRYGITSASIGEKKGTGPICRTGPTNLRSVPGASHKNGPVPFFDTTLP